MLPGEIDFPKAISTRGASGKKKIKIIREAYNGSIECCLVLKVAPSPKKFSKQVEPQVTDKVLNENCGVIRPKL